MYRKSVLLVCVMISLVFAATVWTEDFQAKYDTAEDCKQVRLLILREVEGFVKNDPEQVYSCYSPEETVFYAKGPDDNTGWRVSNGGAEFVRQYADNAATATQFKNPNLQHFVRIKCVNVNGNNAVAVARQDYRMADKENRETYTSWFESVFFAKKIRGSWKITGAVGGIAYDRDMRKNPPPAK